MESLPLEAQGLVVALSGGVDSVVLLHKVLARWRDTLPIRAIHINHQISPLSESWQQFAEQLCSNWQVPFSVFCVDVCNQGAGLEQAARAARYTVFEGELKPGELLLTGHHQQDQAETFMLRLLRGAGVEGLTAMAQSRPLGAGYLWRPLLNETQAGILEYAAQHQLGWVEDDSNTDTHFDRNYLRHKVMPAIAERWPSYGRQLQAATEHLTEASELLANYAQSDLQTLERRQELLGDSIALAPLLALPWPKQKLVLRLWISELGLMPPSASQLAALRQVLTAQADAQPEWLLGRHGFRRFKQRLYCLPPLPAPQAQVIEGNGRHYLHDGSVLAIGGMPEECTLQVYFRSLDGDKLTGLRARPIGRERSQTLKKLLQEYSVPPWLRDRVPLVFMGGQLLAAAGFWIESAAEAAYPDITVQWLFDR